VTSVDVVVPCYRYGHFLRQCVESALSQHGVDVRVLIIDDASPDATAEVATQLVREDSRVTFARHLTNKGHIATYNEGIGWIQAAYYLLLSADDYLLPGALASTSSFMDAHPDVGLAYGRAITLDDCSASTPTYIGQDASWQILTGLDFIKRSGARNVVPTPTAVVRTRLQKQLGGYRPELPHSGDFEMWLRLAAHCSIGVSEAYHAVYRRHPNNMSLLYTSGRSSLDLLQRKSAFDCFINICGNMLPNADKIYSRFSRLLACDAIAVASSAFNDGEMKITEQLLALAVSIFPQINRSLPWAKLLFKRVVGYRVWSAVHPAVNALRKAASPFGMSGYESLQRSSRQLD
jgi:glycosyltransferase involved in cell wall biosynthesis